jgi:urea carboxylase
MPIILGPDGPSLGGFVCPAVVIHSELWKLGQLKAGDKVKFVPVSYAQAQRLNQTYHQCLKRRISQIDYQADFQQK